MRRTTLLNVCLLSLAVVALVVACAAPQASVDGPSQASPEERTARLPEAAEATAATAPTTDPTPSEPVATAAESQHQAVTATAPSDTAVPSPAAATSVIDMTQSISVTILHTNDVRGKTDPCG